MGNSNSRQTFNDKSHPHSKSIPNIGSVSRESEQIYFAHALKLQEQYLLEKNLRRQMQYNEHHQQNLCSSHQAHNNQCETANPNNRFSMHNYGSLMHAPQYQQNQQPLAYPSLVLDNSAKPKSKPSKKLNKLLKKFGSSSTDSTHPSQSTKSLSRSLNRHRSTNTTKSLVMLGNNSHSKPLTEIGVETDFSSYGYRTRFSVGNRLSCVDTFKAIDDNMKAMHLSSNQIEMPRQQRPNLYGSIDLNRSIDLNDSNLIYDSAATRYKYLPNTKTSVFSSNTPKCININNSSSSGCSSIASSSNLSASRRVNQRPDSSLSILSANKMSTPSPPPLTSQVPQHLTKTSAKPNTQVKPTHNTNSHLLTSGSSTKSILSDTTRINQCSTPLDTCSSSRHVNQSTSNWPNIARHANHGHKTGANLTHQHRSFCKKTKHRGSGCDHQLVKSDSVNSFSSILAAKPSLNGLQSSLSSTGVLSEACGFVSSETSSISNSKADNSTDTSTGNHNKQLKHANSVKLAKRSQNRFDKSKSESMYVHDPTILRRLGSPKSTATTSNQTDGIRKKKTRNQQRDSGILVDLFNINGSVSNLRAKFSNATTSIRQSFSTFNLRSLSRKEKTDKRAKRAAKEKQIQNSAGNVGDREASDLEDQEYENTDDNYNSDSEDDDYNEFVRPRRSFGAEISTEKSHQPQRQHLFQNQQQKLECNSFKDVISSRRTRCASCDSKSASNTTEFNNSQSSSSNNYDIIHSPATRNRTANDKDSINTASSNKTETESFRINKAPAMLKQTHDNLLVKDNIQPKTIVDQQSFRRISGKSADSTSSASDINSTTVSSSGELRQSKESNLPKQPYLPTFTDFKPLEQNAKVTAANPQQPSEAKRPSQPNLSQHKKIVVQASTNDLLNCFAQYISQRCSHLINETYINPLCYMNSSVGKRIKFEPRDTINWLRSADCALLIQGWQEIAFMNPVNVVFVYLLVRDTLKSAETTRTVYELQCNIMTCLYLAFSYMGNEISYPLKPFLIEENRSIFWTRTVDLMDKHSANMLKINRDPRYFTELFYELKSHSQIKKSITSTALNLRQSAPRDDLKLYSRKSSYIADEAHPNEATDTQTHIKIDILAPGSAHSKFNRSSLLESATQAAGFSSSQNLSKHNRKKSNEATLSSLCLNDMRTSQASLMDHSSALRHYEQNRPGHKVIFSSVEPQPVAYCI